MIYFNLREADIFQAIKWGDFLVFKFANFLKKIFLFLFLLFFALFDFGLFWQSLPGNLILLSFSISIISFSISISEFCLETFFNSRLKKTESKITLENAILYPEKVNWAQFLDYEAAKSVWQATFFSKRKKFSKIPSEALLYSLLEQRNHKIEFIFSRCLLDSNFLRTQLKDCLNKVKGGGFTGELSPDSETVILEAAKIAQQKKKQRIGIGELLVIQAKIDPTFKKILMDADLKKEDLENLLWGIEKIEEKIEKSKKFWEFENLMKIGSIAREWAAGYTITLDQFSTDWSTIVKKYGTEEMVGQEKELEQIERILSRDTVNSALLIGDPGTGRMKIIKELTHRVTSNLSSPQLNSKRIVGLDMVSALSQSKSIEETEEILAKIFDEVVFAKNVILVIDDFHNFIGQVAQPGMIDITSLISRYLPLKNFQLIAITNYPGFHRFIETSPLLNFFEKVEIEELAEEETILTLINRIPYFENRYKIFISYQAIRDIVRYSARYLPQQAFPKKAIDLLDEVAVYVDRYTQSRIILPEHVARIISDKTQIPVGEVAKKEKEILLNLENLLHQRIIDQEEGVKEITTALIRARADITIKKGPMGCFLFLGPTGVGKTETAKALAETYFGSENKMIVLDMSEFQAVRDISRLIGSTEEEGLLTTPVRENPFSLVLLDEFEKAHPNILNIFLQVFDEGRIIDGLGRKISFLDTIIIATSNAGAEIIWKDMEQDKKLDIVKEDLINFLIERGIFRPELINRFDAVTVFKPLTQENLLAIAELLLQKLKKNLEEKEIEFIITPELKEKLVKLGYNPVFGAREIRRVIQDKVENIIAQALLSGEIKKGDRIKIEPDKFSLIINPKR